MHRFYQWIWNLIYKIYDVQNTPFSGCFTQVFCYEDLKDNIVGLIGCQHQFNKRKKEYEFEHKMNQDQFNKRKNEHKKKYVYHLDNVMDRFYQWIWNLIYKIYDVQNTPFSGCFTQVFCYDDLIDNIVGLIGCQHQFNKYKKEYEREHKKKYVYHLDVQWDEVSGYNVKDDVEDNVVYIDEYGAEFSDDNKQLIRCPKTIVGSCIIPNSVTSIGDSAFFDCVSLTSIVIPDGVTGIGCCAFFNCSSLTSITIPNSVTSIGDSAFSLCSSLATITIPNSVISIEAIAFMYCSSLTSITIPNSVTSIGDWAFKGCSLLATITIPNSVTSIGKGAFEGCSLLTTIDYAGTREQWKKIDKSERWNDDSNIKIIRCTDEEIVL